MFGNDFTIQAIIFKPAKTNIPGVRSEYYLTDNGIKFHLWAEPEFPEDFGKLILKAWAKFPKEAIIVEYVPEVKSWYAEIKEVGIGLSEMLIESLLKKIAAEVEKEHG